MTNADIIAKLEAAGVKVLRPDAHLSVYSASDRREVRDFILDMLGKRGRCEVVSCCNVYAAAKIIGCGDQSDVIGDQLLAESTNILLVPPDGFRAPDGYLVLAEPALLVYFDKEPA